MILLKQVCVNVYHIVLKSHCTFPDSSVQATEGYGSTRKAAGLATKSAVTDGFCSPKGCGVLLPTKLLFGKVGSKTNMGEITSYNIMFCGTVFQTSMYMWIEI